MVREPTDEHFRAGLLAVIGTKRGDQAKLARMAGISASQLNDILKGRSSGSESTRRALAIAVGIEYEDLLLMGKGGKPRPRVPIDRIAPSVILASKLDKAPEISLENYFAAPLVSGSIAAGTGRILSETEIESYVWIYGPELKDRLNHDLISVKVNRDSGDSMSPTIYPDDIVLIDKDDPGGDVSAFKNGAIYAVRDGKGGTAVKRLYRARKGIIISSDNRSVPPETAWTANILELIIGRVVWGWRNLLEV